MKDTLEQLYLFFVGRLFSFGKLKTYKHYKEKSFWDASCALCREVYYTVSLFGRVHYLRLYCNLIIIKIGRFFVRSSLMRASTDCGRLFTIINCRIWKEHVRLLFTFTCEMAKFQKYVARTSLRAAIFGLWANPDRYTTFTFETVVR